MADEFMAESLQSPEKPGWYVYEKPVGWEEEDELDDLERDYRAEMHKLHPEDPDYVEDPVLKAMRLEAEAEQEKQHYRAPRKHAKLIKDHIIASRKLNFDKKLSNASVSSYDTDDFMSQPDVSIFDQHGEQAWMAAYKAKAQRHKKLRKMLANAPAKSPVKVKTPSPVKIAQAYAQQSPAVKKAVAAVLASSSPPKLSPKKFADLNLDSSDDEVPLPTNFAKKMSKSGKKSFFASPSPSKAKSPSPFKPLPAAIKKSFFAAPNLDSDSDDDIDIPGLRKISSPKKFSVTKKSFFDSPSKK